MPRLHYRGDYLQPSRERISSAWRRAGWSYARRLGRFALFGPGAVAAAGLANYFVRVPKLNTMPRDIVGRKRARNGRPLNGPVGGHAPLPRTVIDHTSYVQFKKLSKEFAGRRISLASKMSKIVNSHIQEVVERWGQAQDPSTVLNPGTDALYGKMMLSATVSADPEEAPRLPVYIFDVTSVKNGYAGTPTPTSDWEPRVAHRLYRTGAGNFITTQAVTGVSNLWAVERAPKQVFKAGDRAFIEWLDIRMVLYGPVAKPADVFVEFWQFDDPRKGFPVSASVDGNVTGTGDSVGGWDQNAFNQFWNAKLDTMLGTGIAKRGLRTDTDGCRVLYSKKFTFNPILSTEKDTSGHMVKFNLKYDVNKMCRYDWYSSFDTAVVSSTLDNPEVFESVTTDKTQPFTHPKGRVFMVVRANVLQMVNSVGLTDADAKNVFPSFDLVMRRKRSDVKL